MATEYALTDAQQKAVEANAADFDQMEVQVRRFHESAQSRLSEAGWDLDSEASYCLVCGPSKCSGFTDNRRPLGICDRPNCHHGIVAHHGTT